MMRRPYQKISFLSRERTASIDIRRDQEIEIIQLHRDFAEIKCPEFWEIEHEKQSNGCMCYKFPHQVLVYGRTQAKVRQ